MGNFWHCVLWRCNVNRFLFFATDFDPEDLERGGSDSEDEGGRAADSSAGREHYQAVG